MFVFLLRFVFWFDFDAGSGGESLAAGAFLQLQVGFRKIVFAVLLSLLFVF